MIIPFLSFDFQNRSISDEVHVAFNRVFKSNWYILGEELRSFEANYAAFNRVRHCIGVGNGLDALYIALKVLKIGKGDEVIVPSNTYIATWIAISNSGATVVPVEPELTTFNINPKKIAAALTRKTKLILPVHLYGQACRMTEIMDIALENELFVVEDNAQGHGATYNGQATGSFGHINATSFYPTKNLGALGDGGALTCNSDELAHEAKVIRNYGSEKKYENKIVGVNSRLDEIQAAILNVKLKFLPTWNMERNKLAKLYNALLSDIEGLHLPLPLPECGHIYHLYVIRSEKRNELQRFLLSRGIETAIHYPVPPHLQQAYKSLGYQKGDFPIAEQIANTSLSLPLHPGLSERDVSHIADMIRMFHE